MKKVMVLLVLLVGLLSGCTHAPAGEVLTPKASVLNINNKLYDVRWVRMNDDGYGIYILVPRDTAQAVPSTVNWVESHDGGDTHTMQTAIIVK